MINTQAVFPGAGSRRVSRPSEAEGGKLKGQEWRYRLRRTAGKLLGQGERVYSCGYRAHKAIVDIRRTSMGGLHYGGVETCGSVWSCPVCAARVAEARRDDVQQVIEAHQGMGGEVYMATFTMRHNRFQRAADLLETVRGTWRKMQQGRAWSDLKVRSGVIGTVRALEVTHGQNGWHPHLHVLICTRPLRPQEAEALGKSLWQRWAVVIGDADLVSEDAFRFDLCETPADAGAYVAKWGAASELVKGHSKLGRSGGMSPWQLLREAAHGSREAGALFREYAKAFKGARQLTWSKGFRDLYGFGPEVDDEHLMEDQMFNTETVCSVPKNIFDQIVKAELEVQILCAADDGGWPAVLARLREGGIAWPGAEGWFQRPVAHPEAA